MVRITLAVAFCALFAAPLAAQDVDLETGDTEGPDAPVTDLGQSGLFSHGYVRFGVGTTDGGPMVPFKLRGADSKYRLGNEDDLYGELSVGVRAPRADGSAFVTEVMVNGWENSNALSFGEPANADGDLVQAYAGIEKFGDNELSESFLWAGRRYYRRKDVHITDFYYENMSGDGIGLENVALGPVHMSVAGFYYDDTDSDFQSTALDIRFHDIALRGDWLGEIGAEWIDGTGDDQTGDDGYSIRFHLTNADLSWGEMRNALMYGRGAGIQFDSKGDANATWDDTRLRFVTQAPLLTTEDFQTQATGVWQRTDRNGDAETWISAGLRPQYNITPDWGFAVEAGYDWVDDKDGDRSLAKLTLAPLYTFGKTGFFARPQLRAFVTWAKWSDPGAITHQAELGTATDGTTYGIQIEHWW